MLPLMLRRAALGTPTAVSRAVLDGPVQHGPASPHAPRRRLDNPEKPLDANPQTGYNQPMKVANHPPRRRKVNLQSESFSLGTAKTYLGRLMEKASKGQTAYIVRGEHRFILQAVPQIDPIPIRPAGYFANCYSKEEIREQNQLAKASVNRVPTDLE